MDDLTGAALQDGGGLPKAAFASIRTTESIMKWMRTDAGFHACSIALLNNFTGETMRRIRPTADESTPKNENKRIPLKPVTWMVMAAALALTARVNAT
ncbi:hypothetical protein [Burkholderia sola]|uniref:hypothetical protein n=1 Tax=Burkholderia sola TaxID=2843302 RepID=UPI0023DDEEF2|nr:hypothetical protein [Burkholderia sola]MDF3084254.1 hypothetical protein [Burkholderia sola]